MEGYTTITFHEGKSPAEIVWKGKNIESVVAKGPMGNLSIGMDGSWTYGGLLSAGTDATGNLIIDLSIPWFGQTSVGTTMTFNKAATVTILNFVDDAIIRMPTYYPFPLLPRLVPVP